MFQDLRYGLRMLIKHKGFTAVAVLSLALGIGANTAIFSLIEGVLLRPLPYPDAERMVVLWGTRVEKGESQILASWPDWVSWNEQQQALEGIASFQNSRAFIEVKDESLAVEFFSTSANFFSLLKVPAAFGRTFLPEDVESGGPSIAVLSYGLWQRAFGGDPQVLGKTVLVNDNIFEVIGVMPPTFVSPAGSLLSGLRLSPRDALWVPSKPNEIFHRGLRFLHSIARLKPESTMARAQAEMSTIAVRLEEQYRDTNQGYGVQVVSLHEVVVGGTRQSLLVLFGAVGLVLLIACGNVANLALARASVRQREMSIRAALGARRVRLIRQLLTENLALAALGGAAGLVLAFWTISLVRPLSLQELPRLETVQINLMVLGFAAALSLLTGFLFGLAPALQASNINFNEALKGGHQVTGGRFSNRVRHALIAAEVALSLVLLVGAGLLLQSFWRLQSAHGLRSPENILTLKFDLEGNSKYAGFPNGLYFYEEMLEHVRRIPAVQTVGVTTSLLQIGDPFAHPFEVDGRAPSTPSERPQAGFTMVNSDFFSLAGMRLRAGRLFTDRDRIGSNTAHGPRVVLVNEALARLAFPGEDPVGKQVKVYWHPNNEPYYLPDPPPAREIVGVVTDAQPYNVGVTAKPRIYYPYSQTPENGAILMIRTYGQTAGIFPAVRSVLREMDPGIRIFEVRTAQEILNEATVKPRWIMALLALFASVALVLAAAGIFGVVSYLVAQRTQEIGIRMALGASASHVLKLVVGQNLRVVSGGILCGLGLTFAVTRALSSLLFGITATDPATVLLSSVLLLAVALCASYLPARKASRIDPAVALRHE